MPRKALGIIHIVWSQRDGLGYARRPMSNFTPRTVGFVARTGHSQMGIIVIFESSPNNLCALNVCYFYILSTSHCIRLNIYDAHFRKSIPRDPWNIFRISGRNCLQRTNCWFMLRHSVPRACGFVPVCEHNSNDISARPVGLWGRRCRTSFAAARERGDRNALADQCNFSVDADADAECINGFRNFHKLCALRMERKNIEVLIQSVYWTCWCTEHVCAEQLTCLIYHGVWIGDNSYLFVRNIEFGYQFDYESELKLCLEFSKPRTHRTTEATSNHQLTTFSKNRNLRPNKMPQL